MLPEADYSHTRCEYSVVRYRASSLALQCEGNGDEEDEERRNNFKEMYHIKTVSEAPYSSYCVS